MTGKIFINYRRDDVPARASQIYDKLADKKAFGKNRVFIDVDTLRPGQRFDKKLEKALAETSVLLAVIGPNWMPLLRAKIESGERDYVCWEIADALKRDQITVIPVLTERAALPRAADLPDDIKELPSYQKCDIAHEHFGRDIEALVNTIKQIDRETFAGNDKKAKLRSILRKFSVTALVLGVVTAFASLVVIILYQSSEEELLQRQLLISRNQAPPVPYISRQQWQQGNANPGFGNR